MDGNRRVDALAGVTLEHSSPVPLYHQAAQALEAAIENGRLPRGSKLGGEVELATRLGISRPTMRAAMKQLVDKGLLLRRRGIGTIVAPRPVRTDELLIAYATRLIPSVAPFVKMTSRRDSALSQRP